MAIRKKIIVELSAKNEAVVKRALQGLGVEGARALQRIETASVKSAKSVRRVGTAARRTQSDFKAAAAGITALRGSLQVLAGALAVREIGRYADNWTRVGNRLKLVTDSAGEAARVQERLFTVAQDARSEFGALADLYGRVALASDDLGVSQEQQIRFTEGVAKALAITGTSADQARGALLQLGQAIGAGTVRAEEFNSILEGAPRIARAVADGLDEAGGSVARLRSLVIEGKVSSADFFNAFLTQLPQLRQEFETTDATIGQAFTRLGNSLTRLIGLGDDWADASGNIAGGIDSIREALDRLPDAFADATREAKSFFGGIEDFMRRNRMGFLLTAPQETPTAAGLAGSPELGGGRPDQRRLTETSTVSLSGTGRGGAARKTGRTGAAKFPEQFGPDIEMFERATAEAERAIERIRDFNMRAVGDIIGLIEVRRDRELAALEDIALSEEQTAEARKLINDTATRDIADANERLAAGNKRASESATEEWSRFGESATQTMAGLAIQGDLTVDGILQSFSRLATNKLFQMVFAGGGTGGGDIFAGLFGGGGGSSGFAGVAGSPRAAGIVHGGGVIGADRVRTRAMPAALWDTAPRLHGGLAPDEFPAVLQQGEGVFTRGQMAAMGRVNVTVNNNGGAQIDVREKRGPQGVDVVIDILEPALAQRMLTHGTLINRTVRDVSGGQSRLTAR